jgi:hypothetical protein
MMPFISAGKTRVQDASGARPPRPSYALWSRPGARTPWSEGPFHRRIPCYDIIMMSS